MTVIWLDLGSWHNIYPYLISILYSNKPARCIPIYSNIYSTRSYSWLLYFQFSTLLAVMVGKRKSSILFVVTRIVSWMLLFLVAKKQMQQFKSSSGNLIRDLACLMACPIGLHALLFGSSHVCHSCAPVVRQTSVTWKKAIIWFKIHIVCCIVVP